MCTYVIRLCIPVHVEQFSSLNRILEKKSPSLTLIPVSFKMKNWTKFSKYFFPQTDDLLGDAGPLHAEPQAPPQILKGKKGRRRCEEGLGY